MTATPALISSSTGVMRQSPAEESGEPLVHGTARKPVEPLAQPDRAAT